MNAVTKVASRQSLEPTTLQEAMTFAGMLARSTMVPRDFQGKPENVIVAIQWGREIGLGPLQALQNIAVINGRPSVWGDAMLALVRGSGLCAYVRETIEGEGDAMVATCRVSRKGEDGEIVGTFSMADAKRAGLAGKTGPWTQYPKRMLQMRARGFAIRDGFPDVLRGVISAEEAQDMPTDAFRGMTLDAAPQPMTTGEIIGDEIPEHKPKTRTVREITRDHLVGCTTEDEVHAVGRMPIVERALTNAPVEVREEIGNMLAEALARVMADDGSAAHEPEG